MISCHLFSLLFPFVIITSVPVLFCSSQVSHDFSFNFPPKKSVIRTFPLLCHDFSPPVFPVLYKVHRFLFFWLWSEWSQSTVHVFTHSNPNLDGKETDWFSFSSSSGKKDLFHFLLIFLPFSCLMKWNQKKNFFLLLSFQWTEQNSHLLQLQSWNENESEVMRCDGMWGRRKWCDLMRWSFLLQRWFLFLV